MLPQDTELANVPTMQQHLQGEVDRVSRELQMLRALQPAAMRCARRGLGRGTAWRLYFGQRCFEAYTLLERLSSLQGCIICPCLFDAAFPCDWFPCHASLPCPAGTTPWRST